MPSKSKKQARMMAAVAHNPAFAKKVGIPVSVGKEFNDADKGKKFSKGAKVNKANTRHGKMDLPFSSLKKYQGLARGGGIESSGKTRGRII